MDKITGKGQGKLYCLLHASKAAFQELQLIIETNPTNHSGNIYVNIKFGRAGEYPTMKISTPGFSHYSQTRFMMIQKVETLCEQEIKPMKRNIHILPTSFQK